MSKRKATFTKQTAAENRAMLQRARELLAEADPYSVAKDHPDVMKTIKSEFPGVTEARIWSKMVRALGAKRGNAIRKRMPK